MRFLFFTDSHIRGTTPRNRRDDFLQTLKGKFIEIKQLCKDHKIDYVLHGGDWFDRPDISPAVVKEFAVIIKRFDRPIYSIAGNHDIFGHNPNTLGRTILGLLDSIDVITLIKQGEKIVLDKDGVKVQLTGSPYNYDIDGENFKDYYIIKKSEDVDFAINIVHGMLLERPFLDRVRFTLIRDIDETEADITLAGHYHNGFGIVRSGKKYFINPGSLVRVANTMSEIRRMPKIVVLDLKKSITISEVPLKSAPSGEDVLDRTSLELSKDRSLKLHQFYQQLASSEGFQGVDLNKIVEEIAANFKLSSEVKDEAVRRIGVAREELSSGDENQ